MSVSIRGILKIFNDILEYIQLHNNREKCFINLDLAKTISVLLRTLRIYFIKNIITIKHYVLA